LCLVTAFDAAVTAIRRHMFEMTSHRASMNEHMLAAGDVDWWEWFDANVRHSRKDAEKLMRIAEADLTELGS
jgi:hypothetical protein